MAKLEEAHSNQQALPTTSYNVSGSEVRALEDQVKQYKHESSIKEKTILSLKA